MGPRLGLAAAILTLAALSTLPVTTTSAQSTFTVNSTGDPGDGVCNAAECTLREAIDASNASLGLDVIDFDASVFPPGLPATIAVAGDWLEIHEALTIDGSGAGVVLEPTQTALDLGEPAGRVGLFVSDNTPADPTNFTLTGGSFSIRNFTDNGIFFCGGGDCYSGPVVDVSISGATLTDCGACIQVNGAASDISLTGNEIASGDPGTGIFIGGASMSGVAIEDNPLITGGDFGILLGENTGSFSDVSISRNVQIGDAVDNDLGVIVFTVPATTIDELRIEDNDTVFGVDIRGSASVNDVSVSGNDQVTGGPAVTIRGLPTTVMDGVSVDDNGSVVGIRIGVDGPADSVSNVSVAGNGSVGVLPADVPGVEVAADSVNSVAVVDNGSVSGEPGVLVNGFDASSITVAGNSSVSGDSAGVAISGTNVSDISVSGNTEITSNEFGRAVGVDGGDITNVSIDNNGTLAGGNVGVEVAGDTNYGVSVSGNGSITASQGIAIGLPDAISLSDTNVTIDGNAEIVGDVYHGVAVWAQAISDVSISDNGSITGNQAVYMPGLEISKVAVDSNGSVDGDVDIGNVEPATVSNISVSGNAIMAGSQAAALHIAANQANDIAASDNGDVSGPDAGMTIDVFGPDGEASHISIGGNDSIYGGVLGLHVGAETLSDVSVADNGSIVGGEQGVIVGGETLTTIAIDENAYIEGGAGAGVFVPSSFPTDVSISGNAMIMGGTHGVAFEESIMAAGLTVDDNGSIVGDSELGVSVAGPGNLSGVSISGNSSVSGGQVSVGVFSDSKSDITVRGNGTLAGDRAGVDISGETNESISIRQNDIISGGETAVSIGGSANAAIRIANNAAITGGEGGAVRVEGESNSSVSVVGNAMISSDGNGVNIAGETNNRITVALNGIVSPIGIFILGDVDSRLTITANNVEAGFVGIVLIGSNPSGPRNRVIGNFVHASAPDAAFGILLVSAERTLVAVNLITGFEGSIPDIGSGGGIGVVQESSRNVILANVVQSEPDLFWDESGNHNRWLGNVCDTSVPPGLCW